MALRRDGQRLHIEYRPREGGPLKTSDELTWGPTMRVGKTLHHLIVREWERLIQPNAAQAPETSFALAMLFGPGVGVFFIAAAAIVARHPLGREERSRVQGILEWRSERAVSQAATAGICPQG